MSQVCILLMVVAIFATISSFPAPAGTRAKSSTGKDAKINEVSLQGEEYFFEFSKNSGDVQIRLADHHLVVMEDKPLRTVKVVNLGSRCLRLTEKSLQVFGSTVTNLFFSNGQCDGVISAGSGPFKYEKMVSYLVLLLHSEDPFPNSLKPELVDDSYIAITYDETKFAWRDFLLRGKVVSDFMTICQEGPCEQLSQEATEFVKAIGSNAGTALPVEPKSIPNGLSLNLCGSESSFQFSTFLLGYVTPGHVNDCSENYKYGLPINNDNLIKCRPSSFKSSPMSLSVNPFEELFQQESSLKSTRTDTEGIDFEDVTTRSQLEKVIGWNPDPADNMAFQHCRRHFSLGGKVLNDEGIGSWLHLSRIDNSDSCRMKCNSCNAIFGIGLRPDIRLPNRPAISSHMGISTKTVPYRNTEILRNHMKSPFHKGAVMFTQNILASATVCEKKSIYYQYKNAQDKFYLPTKAFLTFVYAQATAGIPFLVHEKLTKSLEMNGWGFGGLQSNRFAAVSAIESMSNYIRNKFLEQFRSQQSPFSVIIDASTDIANIPYLVVLIQSVQDEKIKIHLYNLLPVKRETAAEMFAAVVSQIDQDELNFPGIANRFRNNLVAIASDNAKVMVSAGKSMYAKFREYAGRNIIQQGCSNHNLELAFEKALKFDDSYLSEFNQDYWDQFLEFYDKHNEFYNFYVSRGNRRWQHFMEVCSEKGIKCKRFKQYLSIRWAESHYRVLEAISANSAAIISDLGHWMYVETTGNNAKFSSNLYNTITNVLYSVILNDQMDFLEVFRVISLKIQRRTLLVDTYDLIEKGVDDLVKLKQTLGPHLKKFLSSCSCGKGSGAATTLEEIENCRKHVYCFETKFEKNRLKLYKIRTEIIEQLYTSLYDYFDIKALRGMKMFDIKKLSFDPQTGKFLPDPEDEENFKQLCKYLNFPDASVSDIFSKLSQFLSTYGKDIQDLGRENPSDGLIYAVKNESIKLHQNVKSIFETIIVLPAGSAEAERAFSFLNVYKTKRRFRLKPSNLQNLLNLRINGESLEQFDGNGQVEHYLKAHGRTDGIRLKRKEQIKIDQLEESSESSSTEANDSDSDYESEDESE